MSSAQVAGAPSPMANTEGNCTGSPSSDAKPTSPIAARRSRVSHACDRCRALRSKCSAEPRCSLCTKDDVACVYSDRKRERNKKGPIAYAEHIQKLEHDKRALILALTEITHNSAVPTEQIKVATDLLAKMSAVPQEQGPSAATSLSNGTVSSLPKEHAGQSQSTSGLGEKAVPPSVGSPGRQGEIAYVFHLEHGSGMTGYVGKMSEVSWLQRVREYFVGQPQVAGSDTTPAALDLHSAQAHDLTYFMDDEDLLSVDEEDVDAYRMPPPATALLLCEAYFHALQGALQFVKRGAFLRILDEFSAEKKHTTWAERRTLGLANIIFALGAKWLDDTKLDQNGITESHKTYYARARSLGLDHRILFDHPDVQMVQAIGILAFYLMTNGSIQRAWSVLGQAIRHATALGLHLQVTPDVITDSVYEDRGALSNSLYQLEVLLCEMTGRSMCIHSLDFTIEMQPIIQFQESGKSSTPGAENGSVLSQSRAQWQSFLGHHRGVALNMTGGSIPWNRFVPVGSDVYPQHFTRRLALSKIRDEIGAELYERAIRMTWFDYQVKTRALNEKLQEWFDSSPDELRVDYAGQTKFDPRSRLELAMYHQSVSMILWRPCLCQITIKDESSASTRFNREGALACVQSAIHMLDMMPDPPVRAEIFEILPWWPVLHYLCQASAVLLLELAMDMQHMQEKVTMVITALRKAIDYLWTLAPHSKSAYKAWNIIRCLVYKLPEKYSTNGLSDVPILAPKPRHWDEGNETMMEVGLRTLR